MCAGWSTEDIRNITLNQINQYDEVFYGKLVNISPVDIEDEDGIAGYGKRYTFEVFEKWIGDNSRHIDFFQISIGCNFHFSDDSYYDYEQEGSKWIVSLEKKSLPLIEYPTELKDSVFYTNLCDLNISEKGEDFKILKSKLDKLFPNKIKIESKPINWQRIKIISLIFLTFLLGFLFGKLSIINLK